ncbi:hypothetical protein K461DRAFT_111029 [Myriangium duriaei CBS 260.36]|uniref:Tat pathway signal sequence n=1 Tax=Myriangium duriaei CBS 260.36 TaxID=1168546 RepID=A0A9P4J5P9_9PEZI|nr:hypothetical protein K461DRAFT_111029 [Myriangium duriaei CBS 260.36]
MDLFRPRQPQSALLAPPPPRRLSTPAGDRLSTILESSSAIGPAHRPRDSGNSWSSKIPVTLPRASADTTPPSYTKEWQAAGANHPATGRRAAWRRRFDSKRGGWGRFLVLFLILLLIVIALAIGLGVGLSLRHKSKSTDIADGDSQSSQSGTTQQFPLGEYTFVTALRGVQTNCTSDADTWRCYPYATYQNDDSTSGLTLFNWVLTASAPNIVTNSTPPTTDIGGIPANISISSDKNPFSISLNNQSLTFVNNDNNPRYTFSFTYSQSIVPSAPVNGDNAATTCVFNQTTFTANLYLTGKETKQYPGTTLQSSSQVNGGFTPWPYAIEVYEYADGGQNVPTCYETNNGNLGQQISSLVSQPATRQCLCKYSNFND